MRIMTNYQAKRSDGNYGSETFCVTFETDTEGSFNNIAEVSDYLFRQAKESVQRQIEGTAAQTVPRTAIPKSGPVQETAAKTREAPKPANGAGNPLPPTEKQLSLIRKSLRGNFQNGDQAKAWLVEKFGVDAPAKLSRRLASRVIEALLEKARRIA